MREYVLTVVNEARQADARPAVSLRAWYLAHAGTTEEEASHIDTFEDTVVYDVVNKNVNQIELQHVRHGLEYAMR
jgi:hypothetical protein